MNFLDKSHLTLKTGEEKFSSEGCDLAFSLLDFWKWGVSDILSNATRGILAEFIVAKALDADLSTVREEWSKFDLLTPEGIKIEVKSSAYLQSWEQADYSHISFSTRAAQQWDRTIEKRSKIVGRSADVYVFCLLHHKDKATINPMNLDQWEFYVLSTTSLNAYQSQYSIALNSLKRLADAKSFSELRAEVLLKWNSVTTE